MNEPREGGDGADGPSQERRRLVERLQRRGYLSSERLAQAFGRVPRERFVPTPLAHKAYRDHPLAIGSGQTISAPHMVAIMVEALHVEPGHRVLDVGTGSGYHAAILGEMVVPQGTVHTVEFHESLAKEARERLAGIGAEHVHVHVGDGGEGWPAGAPFDRINVAAAAPEVPGPLIDQLASQGVLLIPLGRGPSHLVRLTKAADRTVREDLGPCAFVPMSGRYGY